MAAISFLVRVFLPLIPNLPMVGEDLDEETRKHRVWRAQYEEKLLTLLYQELKEKSLEPETEKQCDFAWRALLSTALQQWPYLVIAGGLLLLLGLCWCFRKRRHEVDSSSVEEGFVCILLKVEEEEEESEGEVCDDERDQVLNLEAVKKEEEEEEEEESEGEVCDDERDQVLNLEAVKKEEEEEEEESDWESCDDERDQVLNLEVVKKEEEEEEEESDWESYDDKEDQIFNLEVVKKEEEEEKEEERDWELYDDEEDQVLNLEAGEKEEEEEEEEESEGEVCDDERDQVLNLEAVKKEEEEEEESDWESCDDERDQVLNLEAVKKEEEEEEEESDWESYDDKEDQIFNLEVVKKEEEEEKEEERDWELYDDEEDQVLNLEAGEKEEEEEEEEESEGEVCDDERDQVLNLEAVKKEEEEEEESDWESCDDERDQVLNLEAVKKEEEEEEEESDWESYDDKEDQVLNLEVVKKEEEEEKEEERDWELYDDEEDQVLNLEAGEKEEEEEEEEKEESDEEDTDEEEDLLSTLEVEEEDEERDVVGIFERSFWRPVRYKMYSCQVVEELVAELLGIIKKQLCKSFYPVLQPAIGVGTSFEGWLPCADAFYQLLLPLKAPLGHTFNLELDTTKEMPGGAPRILVELECTCTGQQMQENTLCLIHHSQDITKNQDPNLLQTLCTDGYLDVDKTVCWFQSLIIPAWRDGPGLRCCNLKILSSSRSCMLELTNACRKTFLIEVIFGVQHGDSDIFLSSQAPEGTSTPSTTWPVNYAVAEVKFFKYIASQVPTGRVHLRCLHYCAHILTGTGFSPYVFKTVVMHLLTTIPLSDWHGKYLVPRLRDILQYMFCCLKDRCLKHFFLGNENVPEVISLPPSFREVQPLNLFQHFTQDPVAYAEALSDFNELRPSLLRLLVRGH